MSKIKEETLVQILTERGYDASEAHEIATLCINRERLESGDKEKTERKAAEYVFMVYDPNGIVPTDLTGWIVKKHPASPEGTADVPTAWGDLELESRIQTWGRELSSNSKFKKWKFCCLGDYVEFGNKKLAKQHGLQFITKTPVYVCPVNPDVEYYVEEGTTITKSINSLN